MLPERFVITWLLPKSTKPTNLHFLFIYIRSDKSTHDLAWHIYYYLVSYRTTSAALRQNSQMQRKLQPLLVYIVAHRQMGGLSGNVNKKCFNRFNRRKPIKMSNLVGNVWLLTLSRKKYTKDEEPLKLNAYKEYNN